MKEYQYRVCYKRPENAYIQSYCVDSLEEAEAHTRDHNPYAKMWIERRKVVYSEWEFLFNQLRPESPPRKMLDKT